MKLYKHIFMSSARITFSRWKESFFDFADNLTCHAPGVMSYKDFRARGLTTIVKSNRCYVINRRLFLFSSLSAFLASTAAQAAGDPKSYVQKIGEDVLSLANGSARGKPLRTKFVSLLSRHVNLRTIAASALGTYRSKLPAGDKEKFNGLVTTYAAALFVWYADKFKGADFVVDSVVKQGNFTIVKSKIAKSKLSNEQIVWYLSSKGEGYQVVDLSILGVRLSVAMRDAFSKELKKSKGDFNSLYAFLAEAETW